MLGGTDGQARADPCAHQMRGSPINYRRGDHITPDGPTESQHEGRKITAVHAKVLLILLTKDKPLSVCQLAGFDGGELSSSVGSDCRLLCRLFPWAGADEVGRRVPAARPTSAPKVTFSLALQTLA